MGYYNEPIERTDKNGQPRSEHYTKKSVEMKKAEQSGDYCPRTDAFAQGDGYLGVDDLDRIRREKLKHETK